MFCRLIAIIIPLFFCLCAQPAFSLEEIGPLPEKYEESADWVLSVSAKSENEYLKFPGSPISPLSAVEVSYKVRNEETGAWQKTRSYETLWYHGGKPKGLRRHEKLAISPDSHGLIRIKKTAESNQQLKALTNAALRLLPDIYLSKGTLTAIMYPHELCDLAASELSSSRFYRARKTTGDLEALTLHVVSDTDGFDHYYYYSAIRKGAIVE